MNLDTTVIGETYAVVSYTDRMSDFWGRDQELSQLQADLEQVRRSGQGRLLAVRGRRQVGKSRLINEFAERSGVPYLFATAIKNAGPTAQVTSAAAAAETARRPLADATDAFAAPPQSWADFLARLALAIGDEPSIVVIDEFPWAVDTDPTLEGVLQNAWDRRLEALPVLVILVGSDVTMMERLTEHDRPLFGRAIERVVRPLSPAGVAEAIPDRRDAVENLDLHLVTGGYPRLITEATGHSSTDEFVRAQLSDDSSPLLVLGQRVLSAEFRDSDAAGGVLRAIGSVEVGHATFSSAVSQLGEHDNAAGTRVARSLRHIQDKGLVAIEVPVGARASSKLRRYRITDPYLRFWLRFCSPELSNIERGRADIALDHFEKTFRPWRGRAIEPVVHEALGRLAATGEGPFAGTETVGSWWNKGNETEIDIAAADHQDRIRWLGSVKWRTSRPVDRREAARLAEARGRIPTASGAGLVAVCPAGADADGGFDTVLDANDVLEAYENS